MKILSDYHVHTSFSGDGSSSPRAVVEAAVSRGLKHLCLTDHMDYDYTDGPVCFEFDPKEYFRRLLPLREEFQNQIDLAIGVELGLQPYLTTKNHNLVFSHHFDYIIGSIHLVHCQDPYYPAFFEGREETEAYQEYFEAVLQNLEAFSNFDVFGHLDYVVRYSPSRGKQYSYKRFQEIIDEILRVLVRKNIGLEVNTGGLRYGLSFTNPGKEIISRYRELGGMIVTIGSDAHKPEDLCYEFDRVAKLLKQCGFSSYYIFHDRRPEEMPL